MVHIFDDSGLGWADRHTVAQKAPLVRKSSVTETEAATAVSDNFLTMATVARGMVQSPDFQFIDEKTQKAVNALHTKILDYVSPKPMHSLDAVLEASQNALKALDQTGGLRDAGFQKLQRAVEDFSQAAARYQQLQDRFHSGNDIAI